MNTKKNKNLENINLPEVAIQKIKTELRNWYGSLSIKELIQNKSLIIEIEKLEQLLASQVVVT